MQYTREIWKKYLYFIISFQIFKNILFLESKYPFWNNSLTLISYF